jgi:Bacterial Ig-like domain
MEPRSLLKHKKLIIVFGLIIILLLIVVQIDRSKKFHVVSTNPGTSSVSLISPFLDVNFNKQLVPSSLVINSSSGLVSSYYVQGKSIVINLNTPMNEGQTYSVNITQIADTTGDKLSDISVSFTPKNIALQNLPQDQQAAILKKQTGYQNPLNSVIYSGVSYLTDNGISVVQINQLETDFLQFKPSAKNVSISPNGVEVYKNNSSISVSFSVDFSVTIDGTSYKAVGTYSGINSIALVLYNPQTSGQVYSSTN